MNTCDCGEEVEYFGNEWAKYGDSYEEEIVDVYECSDCKRFYSKRRFDDELELIDD